MEGPRTGPGVRGAEGACHLVFLPDRAAPRFFVWGAGAVASPLSAGGTPEKACLLDETLAPRELAGVAVPLLDALPLLAAMTAAETDRAPASVAGWSLAAKLALDLVGRERLVPRIAAANGGTTAGFAVSLALPEDAERVVTLAKVFPLAAHAVPVNGARKRGRPKATDKEMEVWAPEALLRAFLDATADALVRAAASRAPARASRRKDAPVSWERRFAAALTGPDAAFASDGFRERTLLAELDAWARPALGTEPGAPRACFRLDLPDAQGAQPRRGHAADAFPLRFFLQAADDPSLLVPAGEVFGGRGQALRRLGRAFHAAEEHLLRALAVGARLFAPIARGLRDARPEVVLLDAGEAWAFLTGAAPALAEAGMGVILPAELTRSGQRRLRLRMRVGAGTTGAARTVAGAGGASVPLDFHGKLRPYQERGLGWLVQMADLGLGACLADDMGLGKTIQLLAFLLHRRAARAEDRRRALLVCPTSVVGNWEREVSRFAPSLPVVRHYGPDRARSAAALEAAPPCAMVVTTYGLLRRDAEILGAVNWSVAALDEAQNIKNATSHTARAARALGAGFRVALTGTPVENRLAELWSISEYLNPRLLGTLESFRREIAVPVERYGRNDVAERLRRIVGPFILRRVKSDPGVIRDLPPKQEMKVVCTLTREQASLYQAAVEEAMRRIESADGIQRRGLVLALITALKQICNHPAHYLGEAGPLAGRSGKLARLGEMLEEVVAAGDRALVFTQFREMGNRLVAALTRALGIEVPFLHGGVARAASDAVVASDEADESDGLGEPGPAPRRRVRTSADVEVHP